MYKVLLVCGLALTLASTFFLESCQHDPYFILTDAGNDTTNNGGNDTTVHHDTVLTIACDLDTVYFRNTIFPLLVSNCSMSGCHDATSHKEGVNLTSYSSIRSTGGIKLSKPIESKLYRVLIDNDAEDRMPQGKPPMASEDISRILKWIEQGAQDNYCNECDSTQSQYAAFIRPIMKNSCQGCHSGSKPDGNIDLSSYTGVRVVADNGKLIGAISHAQGYKPMPLSGALPECDIRKIKEWIRLGALNN